MDACESAKHNTYTFSFIEVLQAQVQVNYNTLVYGRNGSPSGLISPPNANGWTQADLDENAPSIVPEGSGGGSGGNSKPPKPPITKLPPANPYNIQATKRYVFNETGNIMLASTAEDSETIKKSVRDVFAEVSVFFAAMTKAISTTINPNAKPAGTYYSLYDYIAVQQVIDSSGLFIPVTEEDINYTTQSVGVEFSKELIEATLGMGYR